MSVQTQPIGQTCTVADGSGTTGSTAVTSVMVSCSGNQVPPPPPDFTIGGTVSGLTASGLELLDNDTDGLTVPSGASMFQFATALASGATYNVTIATQPSGETCSVGSGSGTVGSSDVTSVTVKCSASGSGALIGVTYPSSGGSNVLLYSLSSFPNTSSPTPAGSATLSSPASGVALDTAGNLYALVPTMSGPSAFYECTAASQYATCTTPTTTTISGATGAMAIDTNGNVYVGVVQSGIGSVLSFSASTGPTSTTTVYQALSTAPGLTLPGVAVSPDGSELYVIEESSLHSMVPYQCNSACQASPTSSLQSSLTVANSSNLSGTISVGPTGTLYFGLLNPFGNTTSPPTLAIAEACTPSGGAYTCVSDSATFPVVAGDLNPFVGALAVTADSAGNQYVSVSLNGYGSSIAGVATFYEFSSTGALATCGGASPCPISPSAAANALAVTP